MSFMSKNQRKGCFWSLGGCQATAEWPCSMVSSLRPEGQQGALYSEGRTVARPESHPCCHTLCGLSGL